MQEITHQTTSRLKAAIKARKRPRSTRTAFQLLPKVSKLLDWMLDSTELTVSELFRSELEFPSNSVSPLAKPLFLAHILADLHLDGDEAVIDFIKDLKDFHPSVVDYSTRNSEQMPMFSNESLPKLLLKVKGCISVKGVRRSVALDRDLVEHVERISKETKMTRDICVNMLIYYWSWSWCNSITHEIQELPLKKECIDKAYSSFLRPPEWSELQNTFNIKDDQFWQKLTDAWIGAEECFHILACEGIEENDLERKQKFEKLYYEIINEK